MPTTRKRRGRHIVKVPLLDYVRILLMHGHEARHQACMEEQKHPGAVRLTGKAQAFLMSKRPMPGAPNLMKEAWETHHVEIWKIWKKEKRSGKPWAANIYD